MITQLAEQLAKFPFPEIDLHLRQFNFPWTDHWEGSSRNYALSMLEQGSDPELLALHEYLFGFSGATQVESPDFWAPGHFRLFISHVSPNKHVASELSLALIDYGVTGFVAHEHIEPSREWVQEIEKALVTCDALLAILSPGFKESNWTDQEVGFCHGRKVLVLPVRDGLDPYGFIGRYQAVSRRGQTTEELANEIVRILTLHPKTSAEMGEALVSAFERSGSFSEAKKRVALLDLIPNWNPDLLRRLESAADGNDQISAAWGVPGEVQRILREHGNGSPTVDSSISLFEDDDELPF